MELTTATSTEFDEFLAARNLTVPEEEKPFLLVQSFDFLRSLEFCAETGNTVEAQCLIAYEMREEAGASRFDPFTKVDSKTLIKKGLGRNAIAKEYVLNSDLAGTDPLTLLKSLTVPYGLLKPLLCGAGGIGNFELIR